MSDITAMRRPVIGGRRFANDVVSIEAAAPAARLVLRAADDALAALNRALGVKLPQKPKTSSYKKDRVAMWIGPDEWLVVDFSMAEGDLLRKKVKGTYSAVDVSHRNTGIVISGEGAENVLGAGCAQNLSLAAFPFGACARTVFGKAEVILWRRDEETFHLECWRSFAPYVWGFLADAAKDAAF